MARILVVEDSPDVHRLLVDTLTAEGHEVHGVHDGLQAREALAGSSQPRTRTQHRDTTRASGTFDLVVLDLMLPHVDGSVLLAEFRRTSEVPVLVLSAKDAVYTKVDMLRLGADDYVTKPFDLEELTARIDVLLRRFTTPAAPARALVHGDLVLDPHTARVTRGGRDVELTATEFRILELLMAQPGRVLSRPAIYEAVWEERFVADDAAVKTHLSNLRTKLRGAGAGGAGAADAGAGDAGATDANDVDVDPVETVWGLGYRMRAVPGAR